MFLVLLPGHCSNKFLHIFRFAIIQQLYSQLYINKLSLRTVQLQLFTHYYRSNINFYKVLIENLLDLLDSNLKMQIKTLVTWTIFKEWLNQKQIIYFVWPKTKDLVGYFDKSVQNVAILLEEKLGKFTFVTLCMIHFQPLIYNLLFTKY